MPPASPVDALLLLSFGGPERPADVIPFLENVTRGRGVPRERLEDVAHHYYESGGRSPINELNRQLIADIEAALAAAGTRLPVYFGNRNWHPMVEDTVAQMRGDGVRSALVFPTSAWGGYSGCLQYHEDIARARAAVGPGAPVLTKLRQYYDHPLFVAAFASAIEHARGQLGPQVRAQARLVFTAHSVPVRADSAAGPPDAGGQLYSRQVAAAAQLCAGAAGVTDYDLVWQSRSGPPHVPWLAPDILDHLSALHGVPAVVVCPIGFVSDHMEVIWDLDNEAAALAGELGIEFVRAATPGGDPRFAQMAVELVREHLNGEPARKLQPDVSLGCTSNGAPCAVGCCGS